MDLHRSFSSSDLYEEREFFIDNLLIRIHLIIVMIRWTGLAPWEFEFPFPGSLTSAFLVVCRSCPIRATPWYKPEDGNELVVRTVHVEARRELSADGVPRGGGAGGSIVIACIIHQALCWSCAAFGE